MNKEEEIEELDLESDGEKVKKVPVNEKKSHPIFVSILIVLLFGVFATLGYIGGFVKLGSTITKKVDETEKEKKAEKKELDINSRIVKFLYNEVTSDQSTLCTSDWEYKLGDTYYDDKFEANTADENVKMQIIAKNLRSMDGIYVPVSDVPEISNRRKSKDGSLSAGSYYYTKDYIETIYKQVYGSDATLDTSVPIKLDVYGGVVLYFDSNSQRYYPYYADVGGTCGQTGTSLKLVKAYKEGNTITIYQEYLRTTEVAGSPTKPYNMVYTFELEDDGMYKFVSRVKED